MSKDNAQAFTTKNKKRSKNRDFKRYERFKCQLKWKEQIKYYFCDKKGLVKTL